VSTNRDHALEKLHRLAVKDWGKFRRQGRTDRRAQGKSPLENCARSQIVAQTAVIRSQARPAAHTIVTALLLMPLAASAERVYVKYRGEVDLAPFKCEWVGRSSLVQRLCYDRSNQYLLVSLKGTYYHYCGLPAPVLKEWTSSDSMGRYYQARIKGNFDCRITPPPKYYGGRTACANQPC